MTSVGNCGSPYLPTPCRHGPQFFIAILSNHLPTRLFYSNRLTLSSTITPLSVSLHPFSTLLKTWRRLWMCPFRIHFITEIHSHRKLNRIEKVNTTSDLWNIELSVNANSKINNKNPIICQIFVMPRDDFDVSMKGVAREFSLESSL